MTLIFYLSFKFIFPFKLFPCYLGVDEKLDYLNQMKVKGLILGPIHTVQADQSNTLELTSINPEFGTESDLQSLLDRAHRKGTFDPLYYAIF